MDTTSAAAQPRETSAIKWSTCPWDGRQSLIRVGFEHWRRIKATLFGAVQILSHDQTNDDTTRRMHELIRRERLEGSNSPTLSAGLRLDSVVSWIASSIAWQFRRPIDGQTEISYDLKSSWRWNLPMECTRNRSVAVDFQLRANYNRSLLDSESEQGTRHLVQPWSIFGLTANERAIELVQWVMCSFPHTSFKHTIARKVCADDNDPSCVRNL